MDLQGKRGGVFNREDYVHVDLVVEENRKDKLVRLYRHRVNAMGDITVPDTGFGHAEV